MRSIICGISQKNNSKNLKNRNRLKDFGNQIGVPVMAQWK